MLQSYSDSCKPIFYAIDNTRKWNQEVQITYHVNGKIFAKLNERLQAAAKVCQDFSKTRNFILQLQSEIQKLTDEKKVAYETGYDFKRKYEQCKHDMDILSIYHGQLQIDKDNLEGKVKELSMEIDRLIQSERDAMDARMTSVQVTDDLASIIALRGVTTSIPRNDGDAFNGSFDVRDIFVDKDTWHALLSRITPKMTVVDTEEICSKLSLFKNAFDVICTRMVLETKRKTETDNLIVAIKIELQDIKDRLRKETKIRIALEEELKFVKKVALQEKEWTDTTHTAALDAIKQSKFYQIKMNREIDILQQHQQKHEKEHSYESYNDCNDVEKQNTSSNVSNNKQGPLPLSTHEYEDDYDYDVRSEGGYFENTYLSKNLTYPHRRKIPSRNSSPVGNNKVKSKLGNINVPVRKKPNSPVKSANLNGGMNGNVQRRLFHVNSKSGKAVPTSHDGMGYGRWIDPSHIDYRLPRMQLDDRSEK